jgi:TPR repeat protein
MPKLAMRLVKITWGVINERGRGVTRNATEAVHLFRLAAAQGLAAAQYNVGRAYAKGLGVRKNRPEAARWYRMAAEQGDPAAQNALAILKATGRGSLRDPDAALDLFRRAAMSGYSLAQFNLAATFDQNRLVPHDPLRAYIWYSIAARLAADQVLRDASSAGSRPAGAKNRTPRARSGARRRRILAPRSSGPRRRIGGAAADEQAIA